MHIIIQDLKRSSYTLNKTDMDTKKILIVIAIVLAVVVVVAAFSLMDETAEFPVDDYVEEDDPFLDDEFEFDVEDEEEEDEEDEEDEEEEDEEDEEDDEEEVM